MDLSRAKRQLSELHASMTARTARDRELLRASRDAIEDSRALLDEIARRHPEIDFKAPQSN